MGRMNDGDVPRRAVLNRASARARDKRLPLYGNVAEDTRSTFSGAWSRELGNHRATHCSGKGTHCAILVQARANEEMDYKRHLIRVHAGRARTLGHALGSTGVCRRCNTCVLGHVCRRSPETRHCLYSCAQMRARLAQALCHVSLHPRLSELLVCLGGTSWCLLPWLGAACFSPSSSFLRFMPISSGAQGA